MTEYIIIVALIAIARKIIILDLDKYDGVTLVGIAAIIFSITSSGLPLSRAMSIWTFFSFSTTAGSRSRACRRFSSK